MLSQLARYGAAMPLVDEISPQTVLEVGSGSEGLARFAEGQFELTACDQDFSDCGTVGLSEVDPDQLRSVEGDVTDLPFGDREFDVVIALDLLEHVPEAARSRALSEMARVSSSQTIVGCPCGSEALEADRKLAQFYDLLPRRVRPPWLVEHLENGFPEPQELTRPLAEFGNVRLVANESLSWHRAVSILESLPLVVRASLRLAALPEPGLGDCPLHDLARTSIEPASRWRSATNLSANSCSRSRLAPAGPVMNRR